MAKDGAGRMMRINAPSGDDLIYPPYPCFTCTLLYRPVSSGEKCSKEKRGEEDSGILERGLWNSLLDPKTGEEKE